jgi:hypothetical protein
MSTVTVSTDGILASPLSLAVLRAPVAGV